MNKTFLILLLMVSAFCFANDCNLCQESCQVPKPSTCAFNAPYNIELKCSWDMYLTASFLYYKPQQEQMIMAMQVFSEDGSMDQAAEAMFTASQIQLDMKYKPAFKIGLGFDIGCDNWDLFAEYTWYDHTFSQNTGEVTSPANNTIELFIRPCYQLVAVNPAVNPDNLESLESNWNLNIDFADMQLARNYFVGKCLTFRSFYGLRAAWISQKLSQAFSVFNLFDGTEAFINTKHKTTSWGIGPRAGLNMNWFFCEGFRFFSNANAALLYTEYKVRANENYTNVDENTFGHRFDKTSLERLRGQTEFNLGIGWGDCFCNKKWFFDVELGYNFIALWNQNMFVQEESISNIIKWGSVEKSLYLHGLTVTAHLDF